MWPPGGASDSSTDEEAQPDLRMVPIAASAWAGCWAGTSGSLRWGLAGVGVALFLLGWGVLRRSMLAVALALVVGGALGLSQVHLLRVTAGPVADLAHAQAVADLLVQTVGDPHTLPARGTRPASVTIRARVVEIDGRGQRWRTRAPVLIVSPEEAASWEAAPVGTVWAVTGRLAQPRAGSDLSAVVRVRQPPRVAAPAGWSWRAVDRVRLGLREAVAERRPEVRALVPALVLGDTAALPPDLVADFRTTGLSHLTAVSGANLTLLLAFLLLAARWCKVRGRWLRVIAVAGVVVFVALCRSEPSVLRAAAMGLVTLAALGAGGRRGGHRNLSVAMTALLLVDPFLARSYGFALSVLACLGIISWAARWARELGRWMPGPLAEAVSVPLAAHLATMPVVAQLSEMVSAAGLIANALAGPFVGPATVSGFAAAGLSLVSARLAAAAGFAAAWFAQPIVWVAHLGAALPGAAWPWPSSWPAVTLLAVVGLGLGWLMPALLSRRWLSLVLAVALVAALIRGTWQPGWPPRDWLMVACSVGQGDALVVRAGRHEALLVDVGPDPGLLDRCLDELAVDRIPVLVLTHFHADHVDGLAGLADRPIGRIWASPVATPPDSVRMVHRVAAARGVPVETPPPGSSGHLGDLEWQVLGPVDTLPAAQAEESENDASLVLGVTARGVRLLLTGDIEPLAQQALLAAGTDLRADVLKVPHHGSSHQEPAFFRATGATLAVASVGRDNSYGHPAARTVDLARSLGMTFLRTDVQGSVAITATDQRLRAVVQRPGVRSGR
jgi:competence protein ComEC